MQEGVASEACSLAGHLGLGRLIAFYDDNQITIEGDDRARLLARTSASASRPTAGTSRTSARTSTLDRIEARDARGRWASTDRPSLIIVPHPHRAPARPNKQDTAEAHGAPLGEEEVRLTKEAYGWPSERAFLRPRRGARALPRVRRARARVGGASGTSVRRLRGRATPSSAPSSSARIEATLPEGWDADLPHFDADDGDDRHAQGLGQGDPVGGRRGARPGRRLGRPGAARHYTLIEDGGDVAPGDYGGRNLHFGVREHGMGAIVNGLTPARLPGLRRDVPDLLRLHEGVDPARRADAASRRSSSSRTTRSASARTARPTSRSSSSRAARDARTSTWSGRPDANETALAWRFALEQTETPDRARADPPGPAGAGTRPACPTTRSSAAPTCCATSYKGRARPDPDRDRAPRCTLCNAAADQLEADGIATRVVSMPVHGPLRRAGRRLPRPVLPPAVPRARVPSRRRPRSAGTGGSAMTASVDRAWTRFGASAPAEGRSTSTSASRRRRHSRTAAVDGRRRR